MSIPAWKWFALSSPNVPERIKGIFKGEEFLKEFNELLNIEHDLETETLSWPNKIEDGFSATDLNILEMFFNIDEMVEPKEETDNQ